MRNAWRAVGIVWLLNLINATRLIGERAIAGTKPRGIDYIGAAIALTMVVGTFVALYYVLKAYSAARRSRHSAPPDAQTSSATEGSSPPAATTDPAPVATTTLAADDRERFSLAGRGALALSLVSMNPINGVVSLLSAVAAYWNALRHPGRGGGLISATVGALISCVMMTFVWQTMASLVRPDCRANIERVSNALVAYNRQHRQFPPTLDALFDAKLIARSQACCVLESSSGGGLQYKYLHLKDPEGADPPILWCDSPRHGSTRPVLTPAGIFQIPVAELQELLQVEQKMRALSAGADESQEFELSTIESLFNGARRVNLAASARSKGDQKRFVDAVSRVQDLTQSAVLNYRKATEAFLDAERAAPENLTSTEKITAARAELANCVERLNAAREIFANIGDHARRIYREEGLAPARADAMAKALAERIKRTGVSADLNCEAEALDLFGQRLLLLESTWGRWEIRDGALTFENDGDVEKYNQIEDRMAAVCAAAEAGGTSASAEGSSAASAPSNSPANGSTSMPAVDTEGYDQKTQRMVELLGPEHDLVSHAVPAFHQGGSLDLYYYPQRSGGTAIATKQVSTWGAPGPSNSAMKSYELAMFTRHAVDLKDLDVGDKPGPFGDAKKSISAVLNALAHYCPQAVVEPGHTLEFPKDMEEIGGKCLIFEMHPSWKPDQVLDFGLLIAIEIHRDEMEFAMSHGAAALLDLLWKAGYLPYSDLDRPSVAPRRKPWRFW